jgi:hypothetical protein
VNLTYRYRLLPLKSQHRAIERLCAVQREWYNAALEERPRHPPGLQWELEHSLRRDWRRALNVIGLR